MNTSRSGDFYAEYTGVPIKDLLDDDGTPDYMDPDTSTVRNPNGLQKIRLHTSAGQMAQVSCVKDTDASLQQTGKPNRDFPYGVNKFLISGLTAGQTVTLTLIFPEDIPVTAQYYKADTTLGWRQVPFDSNDGDGRITLTLTDGDPQTDADGIANGIIDDHGAITTSTASSGTSTGSSGGGGGGGCFISILQQR